jgi:hypothetical protein
MYFFPQTFPAIGNFFLEHAVGFTVKCNLQLYNIYIHVLVSVNERGNNFRIQNTTRNFLTH